MINRFFQSTPAATQPATPPPAPRRGRVLAIANRGEIALRIARTATQLGWQPIALLGAADRRSLVARELATAELPFPGAEFDAEAVATLAQQVGADALHPGYGFLSERAELADACAVRGIAFVGPNAATLATCGDKAITRRIAAQSGVPVLPASPPLTAGDDANTSASLHTAASSVGYPLMVKIAGGGGGRGLRVVQSAEALDGAIAAAVREAGASGAGVTYFFERYLHGARHVEVQVLGDGRSAVALGDRDCTLQRRHQKVIEEAPAANLTEQQRLRLHADATRLAQALNLVSLATVEFLLESNGQHWFIEVNPRLQVEHTVTEQVTGLDLVALQLHLLDGAGLPPVPTTHGHAVQARLYAEDPFQQFVPAPGQLRLLQWPRMHVQGLRVDSGYASGDSIPRDYDPLIAKLITHGSTRDAALDRLADALRDTRISGTAHNRPWMLALLNDPDVRANTHTLDTAGDVQVTQAAPTPDALRSAARTLIPDSDGSAWGSNASFRIGNPATITMHGDEAGGWQSTVSLTPQDLAAERGTDGVTVIDSDAGFEISSADGWWLARPGGRRSSGEVSSTQDGRVRAPMPGTITAIHAEVGQQVAAGAALVTMTAMKIDIALAAPLAGRVERIDCAVGDLLSTQQIVAIVTPLDADDTPAATDASGAPSAGATPALSAPGDVAARPTSAAPTSTPLPAGEGEAPLRLPATTTPTDAAEPIALASPAAEQPGALLAERSAHPDDADTVAANSNEPLPLPLPAATATTDDTSPSPEEPAIALAQEAGHDQGQAGPQTPSAPPPFSTVSAPAASEAAEPPAATSPTTDDAESASERTAVLPAPTGASAPDAVTLVLPAVSLTENSGAASSADSATVAAPNADEAEQSQTQTQTQTEKNGNTPT